MSNRVLRAVSVAPIHLEKTFIELWSTEKWMSNRKWRLISTRIPEPSWMISLLEGRSHPKWKSSKIRFRCSLQKWHKKTNRRNQRMVAHSKVPTRSCITIRFKRDSTQLKIRRLLRFQLLRARHNSRSLLAQVSSRTKNLLMAKIKRIKRRLTTQISVNHHLQLRGLVAKSNPIRGSILLRYHHQAIAHQLLEYLNKMAQINKRNKF